MSQSLTDFVLKLAEDPGALKSFQASPAEVMRKAGLTEDAQEVLMSNDPQRIRVAIANDTGGKAELAGTTIVITAILIVRPEEE